ncbi:MAG: DUF4199 domain-containing protein [Paludibacteraceae bacterium]|nr:DUF4199 domain-containing protein [Paludibacteraceae bacterium]
MENITSHAMRSGLYLGVTYSILNILSWLVSSENSIIHAIISLTICVATFYFIYHFTRLYNEEVLQGDINYPKAYVYGLRMFFYAGMIAAVVTYIFFKLNPETLSTIKSDSLNMVSQWIIDDKALSDSLKSQIGSLTVKDYTISVLWCYIIVGLFLCLFTSISFRKKEGVNIQKTNATNRENINQNLNS